MRRSGSSCSRTPSTRSPASSRSATCRRPRTTPTGSSASSARPAPAIEASVQHALTGTWMIWVLNHLYLIAQLGRPARRADLPLPPLRAPVRGAAQHDPGDLADLRAGLRAVPRRAAAAGRHRPGGHDHDADGLRDGLQPDDELLQRARRRPEPARRLRRRDRRRGRRGRQAPAAQVPRADVGTGDRPRRGRHRQPLRLRHRRRPRRQRRGLRPRHHRGADPHQAAGSRPGWAGPSPRPERRFGGRSPVPGRCRPRSAPRSCP